MKAFVGITGTTCVGKSEAAVALAKMLNTEIISADSVQIYKGMDIGTAKITKAEMQGVTHHMLDILPPNQKFSSFEYSQAAGKIVDEMRGLPIVAGGTGFYIDSLVYPPEFGAANEDYREKLRSELDEKGLEFLCERLKSADADAYEKVDLKNPVRVMRALEIAERGEKRSMAQGRQFPRYNMRLFVLQRNRKDLYAMIEHRVDEMIEMGLVDEVRSLVNTYGVCETSAFSAIGYKEIVEYLRGNIGLAEAIEQIKLNTRHYAKRQITYFRKMNVHKYLDVDGCTPRQIAEQIYADCRDLL